MSILTSYRRALLVAGSFALLTADTVPTLAQAPAPGAPAAGADGRPDGNEAASKLAPVSAPPLPAAADKLPTAKLKLPPGFNIEVYASGIGNARSLRIGDKGTVLVGTRFGN